MATKYTTLAEQRLRKALLAAVVALESIPIPAGSVFEKYRKRKVAEARREAAK